MRMVFSTVPWYIKSMVLLTCEQWQVNLLSMSFILRMRKLVSVEFVAKWVWWFYRSGYYNFQGLFN